jgi:Zn-dependent metalloprotease
MQRISKKAFVLAIAGLVIPQSLEAEDAVGVRVVHSRATGNASFVSMANGQIVPVNTNTPAPVSPRDFFRQYGHLFGVQDTDQQLKQIKIRQDDLGHVHTEFDQVHGNVRVLGGSLRTHQNDRGEFVAASGKFFPVSPKIGTKPKLDRLGAEVVAKEAFGRPAPSIDHMELVIVDPGWYGDRPQGERLAIRSGVGLDRGEAEAFVDAISGRILDQWSLLSRPHSADSQCRRQQSVPGPVRPGIRLR